LQESDGKNYHSAGYKKMRGHARYRREGVFSVCRMSLTHHKEVIDGENYSAARVPYLKIKGVCFLLPKEKGEGWGGFWVEPGGLWRRVGDLKYRSASLKVPPSRCQWKWRVAGMGPIQSGSRPVNFSIFLVRGFGMMIRKRGVCGKTKMVLASTKVFDLTKDLKGEEGSAP